MDNDSLILIRTKLQRPVLTADLIGRPHLLDQLNRGLRHKLTLISAPAGYGKTTLMAVWLQQVEQPVAWLSLDEADDALFPFLSYLVAAVQSIYPNATLETQHLSQLSQAPAPELVAATLINDLVDLPNAFILALDDFHFIHDDAILKLITVLIEHQPANLHLVLATRIDPRLPLARLRAAGTMTEIRQQDLRFQVGEAERFLQQTMTMTIDRKTVRAVNDRIEGWITGLRLAALSLQGQTDAVTFLSSVHDGPSTFVHDYLVGEVLVQLPKAIRMFLLRTAILDRLCGPLCEAVASADDPECNGQAYLDWLFRQNLFLVSLDDKREWFRYHHLFQTLLKHELQARYPAGEINALHHRASAWFADEGHIEEAIRHALAADDMEAAAKLVEENGQNLLNRVERHTLERWLGLLPEELVWQRPKLLIPQAWLFYLQWRMTALAALLDHFDRGPVTELPFSGPEEARVLEGHINVFHCVVAYIVRGDLEQARRAGDMALQQLPTTERGALSTALWYWALAQQGLGNEDVAISRLNKAINDPSGQRPSRIQAYAALAILHYQGARLVAMDRTQQRLKAHASKDTSANAIALTHWLSGLLHYERNALNEAHRSFKQLLDFRYRTNFAGVFLAVLGLARIAQIQGDLRTAQAHLDSLRQEVLQLDNDHFFPPFEAFQARQHLLQGETVAALDWASAFRPSQLEESIFWFEVPTLTRARIIANAGTGADVQSALDSLQETLQEAEGRHFTLRVIQIESHLALLYDRLGQNSEALKRLKRAVKLGEPAGVVRSILDGGPQLARLLAQMLAASPSTDPTSAYVKRLLDAFSREGAVPQIPQQPSGSELSVERLTRRELEIVQFMDKGMTNQEIADRLVISPHTVRRHATNIYNKLGVSSRRTATRKARQLGIL